METLYQLSQNQQPTPPIPSTYKLFLARNAKVGVGGLMVFSSGLQFPAVIWELLVTSYKLRSCCSFNRSCGESGNWFKFFKYSKSCYCLHTIARPHPNQIVVTKKIIQPKAISFNFPLPMERGMGRKALLDSFGSDLFPLEQQVGAGLNPTARFFSPLTSAIGEQFGCSHTY